MSCFPLFLCQAGASLQQKADGWRQKVNDTRGSRPRTPTYLDQDSQVQKRLFTPHPASVGIPSPRGEPRLAVLG